jgi:hypothetical protein
LKLTEATTNWRVIVLSFVLSGLFHLAFFVDVPAWVEWFVSGGSQRIITGLITPDKNSQTKQIQGRNSQAMNQNPSHQSTTIRIREVVRLKVPSRAKVQSKQLNRQQKNQTSKQVKPNKEIESSTKEAQPVLVHASNKKMESLFGLDLLTGMPVADSKALVVPEVKLKTEGIVLNTSVSSVVSSAALESSSNASVAIVLDDAFDPKQPQLESPVEGRYEYRFIGLKGSTLYRLTGALSLSVQNERYELILEADSLLGGFRQVSTGFVTSNGLVPERYETLQHVILSKRREAINFQRDKQQLTGKRYEAPILPGMDLQDQTSVQVQLGLLLKRALGKGEKKLPLKLQLHVASMSQISTWVFLCDRTETIAKLNLVHCVRDEKQQDDQQNVEVWIDPSSHWLPARVRIADQGRGWVEQYTNRWDEEVILPAKN